MEVKLIFPRGYAANSYVLTADGKNAVVIDPAPEIADFISEHKLKIKGALLTHGHFDHVGGAGVLSKKGVPIYCGEAEKDFIFSKENRGIFGGVFIPEFSIAGTFKDGERFNLGGISFKAMSTPGHTAGSMCYFAEDCVFTGDTLFCGGVGRTDLPTGNFKELISSVRKLLSVEGDYKVYSGHGEETTLELERKFNAFARY